jgi:mannose-6-phosphate isomerase-like protein (cupin superfamily)
VPANILENPVTKERLVVLASETAVLRLEEQVPVDMIQPPVHLHRRQEERFEVIEGQVTVQVRNERHVLGAGGSLVVPPGTPHTWWNSGSGKLRMLTEFRPADNVLSFFETFCGLAQEGRANEQGGPPFLQVVASARHWDSYLGAPPVPIQRALFAVLRPVARWRGYRESYDRFQVGPSRSHN